MALSTRSAFLFGFDITASNKYLDFQEGATEYNAEIILGAYTLDGLATAVEVAMNALTSNNYVVTVDYATRTITIAGDATFSLLVTTGTNTAVSIFSLLGFTSDKSGASTYSGDTTTGSQYLPQFNLQNYTPFEHIERSTGAQVNQSASGVVEIVEYSRVNFMESNIKYITNITSQGVIDNNANGVTDYLTFIQYGVKKKPLVFIKDIADYTTYVNCIIESTPESGVGIEFKLKELTSQNLPGYYESGTLTFRKLV